MEISRLCASLYGDFDHGLTAFQTNVLVGGDGGVHIAGLGTAFIPSTMLAVLDVDRSFNIAAVYTGGEGAWNLRLHLENIERSG